MRKLHKVMIAAAAAGGLSAVGAGTSVAYDAAPSVSDLYRPYQECSPQTVAATDTVTSTITGSSGRHRLAIKD